MRTPSELFLAVVAGEPCQRQERLRQVVAEAGPDVAVRHAGRVQAASQCAAGGTSCRRRRPRPAPPAGSARAPPARVEQRSTAPGQSVQADGHRPAPAAGTRPASSASGRAAGDAATMPPSAPRDLVDAGRRQHDRRAAGQRRPRSPPAAPPRSGARNGQQEGVAARQASCAQLRGRQHADAAVDRDRAAGCARPGPESGHAGIGRCPGGSSSSSRPVQTPGGRLLERLERQIGATGRQRRAEIADPERPVRGGGGRSAAGRPAAAAAGRAAAPGWRYRSPCGLALR